MAEKTRNLCAEIPLELHTKVRQRQAESGETLSRYMTVLITKFYEMEEKVKRLEQLENLEITYQQNMDFGVNSRHFGYKILIGTRK